MQIINFDNREIAIGSLSDFSVENISTPFAILVAAFSQQELDEVVGLAKDLIELGCKEFCCVGVEAERLHDQLDHLIEDSGSYDIVTTWHDNLVEGCEYLLFGAGGQQIALFGLVSKHPEILEALKKAAQTD
ncbi:hypothetical protein [Sneathiella sp.]|uniref:hypothetical protein n=1 Tax=Sneathiella sp. TaxID=1964365 RepID=UPI0035661868